MNPPPAVAAPHPWVEGGWTIEDKLKPTKRPLLFASKERAETVASQRNEQRRHK